MLDPNSDFARLGELRPDADGADAARYTRGDAFAERAAGRRRPRAAARGARSGDAGGGAPPRPRSATARSTPSWRRSPTAARRLTLERWSSSSATAAPAGQLIGRARNLGLHRWGIWAGADRTSLLPELARDDVRCLVVDLGSLATREEQALASAAVLGELWRRREERRPVLIVDRRGAQRLPGAARGSADRDRDGARRPDRGRGPQVRALPARLHAAAAEGARERALAVRQPAADADELARRPRLRRRDLLVRAARACSSGRRRSGRASRSRPASIAPHPAFLRFGKPARAGRRRRRARRLVAAAQLAGLSSTTSSTRSRPSGRCVISSTERSSAAAEDVAHEQLGGLGVEVRGRLVEHEHRRIGEERPRDGQALTLPARRASRPPRRRACRARRGATRPTRRGGHGRARPRARRRSPPGARGRGWHGSSS